MKQGIISNDITIHDLLLQLRSRLHNIPEPSMRELGTKRLLMDFLNDNTDNLELVDRGTWFYARKKAVAGESDNTSPIAFRADYDAVMCADGRPRHLCGHDGHSTVLSGLALWLDENNVGRDVYLIFQPGEETGEGAVICSELIAEKGISEIYGFHNIPGYEENDVLLLENTFACASTGLEICFEGKESHAAYPEQGMNPGTVIADTIRKMDELIQKPHRGIVLGTVIGIAAGSSSYGVSAGKGTLRLTLRAEYQDEYDSFVSSIEEEAVKRAKDSGLTCRVSRIEEFPATMNAPDCVEKVRNAAEKLGMKVVTPKEPFRWSEDFGYYLQKTKGAFFGVGCGKEHAGLHTPEYGFNDEIIGTVVRIFSSLSLG